MPRDLSGNMTLVTGNPVTTGTAISSTVMNSTMTDLAAEIQDSLSRSGKGGMTAAFKNADGTEAAPGLTFTNESSTGWYRSAAGVIRMSILGAWKFWYNAAGMIIKGALGLMDPAGTNKTVTLAPPTGLAADYTLTMPTALPASTLPVTCTSAGVLSTGQLVNAQQNFGTPSAATDAVILSYLTPTSAATTSVNANISSGGPTVYKSLATGRAWFANSSGVLLITGAITGCGNTGDFNAATALWTVPAGYRLTQSNPNNWRMLPVLWQDASFASSGVRVGALVFAASSGVVYFWAVDSAGAALNLANGDAIYLDPCPTWIVTA